MDALRNLTAVERAQLVGRVALRAFALVGLDCCLRSGVDAAVPRRGSGALRFAALAILRAWVGKHTAARPQAWRIERRRLRGAARGSSDGLFARLLGKPRGGSKKLDGGKRGGPQELGSEGLGGREAPTPKHGFVRSAASPAGLGVALPVRRRGASEKKAEALEPLPLPPSQPCSPSRSLSSASSDETRVGSLTRRPAGLGTALPARPSELRA